ncbi:hypothetical protein AAG906_023436 [Vitis piasezkii]
METVLETPSKSSSIRKPLSDYKTPPQIKKRPRKSRILPTIRAIKPLRPTGSRCPRHSSTLRGVYRSPTDLMISPVSKGLLARSRKTGSLLPPAKIQPKVQDLRVQEVGLFQA